MAGLFVFSLRSSYLWNTSGLKLPSGLELICYNRECPDPDQHRQVDPGWQGRNITMSGAAETSHYSKQGEWPTWIVLMTNYLAWLLITWNQVAIPWWLMIFAGGMVICIHGSLQHERLHGHPTHSDALNKALVWLPLGLWMPFTIYRDSHIAHHRCDRLTDPLQDPESYYILASEWSRYSPVRRVLLRFNNTLIGRLTVGPLIAATSFLHAQARMLLEGDRRYASVWAWHLAGCALVLYWVVVCGMPFWQYVLLVAWPGLSFTLLRSFTEHRPSESLDQRTIIIEGSWLTRLLFLNNNYHHVHHSEPGLAWYELGSRYRASSARVLAENGGFYYRSYFEVFRQYLFRTKDEPVYTDA